MDSNTYYVMDRLSNETIAGSPVLTRVHRIDCLKTLARLQANPYQQRVLRGEELTPQERTRYFAWSCIDSALTCARCKGEVAMESVTACLYNARDVLDNNHGGLDLEELAAIRYFADLAEEAIRS